PPLIRKQVILSETVQAGMDKSSANDIAGLVAQVLSRDASWLKFYRETVDGLEVSSEALDRVKERETQLASSAEAECKFMTRLWQGDTDGARKELLDVLDATALADAKLAGWYSLWLGASYEAEGDLETAIAHYKKSRARLSYFLNVPYKNEFEISEIASGSKTTLQTRLLSVNHHGPQALGDLVAKLKSQIAILESTTTSSAAKEEAVRSYGELLGFGATRPDNEEGHGPDVVWKDDADSTLVAFELKTEKNNPAEYNKAEVGQAHNHIQWLKDNLVDYTTGGLLLVGPPGVCKAEASPSEEIFLVETDALTTKMWGLVTKIDDVRGRTNVERYALLEEIGALEEWQLPGVFTTLAQTKLRSLKA
ncbi:MAG: hypothetical protein KA199_01615, partial [Sphingorhabdus sp.]|nr:hypothetical protein [Sphingorhabdus sp.]